MYSPAPSPFGNMVGGGGVGTANLSHTSTAMLVPMHSQAGPHSVILGPGGGPPQMGRMKRPFRTITPPTLSPFATPTNNGSICECPVPSTLVTNWLPSFSLPHSVLSQELISVVQGWALCQDTVGIWQGLHPPFSPVQLSGPSAVIPGQRPRWAEEVY